MVLPDWFRFEQGMIASGMTPDRKDELKRLIEKAPDYELARYYGRITLGEMLRWPKERDILVPEALWAMQMAVERHPFDAESRLNLARTLEAGGDDEGAAREYLAGIEATWRREDKYGGMSGFADHLARRGEEYFLARKPEKALGCYRRAMEYLERSWELGYRHGGSWRVAWPEYKKKLKFLQNRIEFLEGAGIQAENLDGKIPPPPED